MKVFLVFFAKKVVQLFNFIGKININKNKNYKYTALIVGNYEYKTVCQKQLIERLQAENISHKFLFTVEKKSYFSKIIAYAICAYYTGKSRNIIIFDYCFPVFCMKKLPEQKVYQLWHANGAFKRVGLPNFREKYGEKLAEKLYKLAPIHANYDYIFVSNEKSMPHYMQAFNDYNREKYYFSNNIFLDMLIDSSKNQSYNRNNDDINIILAPTFNYIPEENIYEQLTNYIYEEAKSRGLNVNVRYLLHPKFAENYDKISIMLNSDVLVTDYSSVCFEAAAIGKKVAFLRSKENLQVFMEVAKKVYYDPRELAIEILENKLVDNDLSVQLTIDGEKQIDIVTRLLKENIK